MRLNKKQIRLIEILEKCKYLFRSEVNKQEFPDSMIDALIKKELITEFKGKLTSSTK